MFRPIILLLAIWTANIAYSQSTLPTNTQVHSSLPSNQATTSTGVFSNQLAPASTTSSSDMVTNQLATASTTSAYIPLSNTLTIARLELFFMADISYGQIATPVNQCNLINPKPIYSFTVTTSLDQVISTDNTTYISFYTSRGCTGMIYNATFNVNVTVLFEPIVANSVYFQE